MKRILAFSLAVIMLLACMTGCSGKPSYKEDTVMTVNGVEISWDEYMFWIGSSAANLNYQYSMSGRQVDWTAKNADGVSNAQRCVDNAHDSAVLKAIINGKCAELGIVLNDDEKAEVQKSIDDYKTMRCGEDATDEQFEAYLKNNDYCNLSVMKSVQTTTALVNKLFTELFGEDGAKVEDTELMNKAVEKGYTKANHILFMTVDRTTEEPLSDSEKAAKKAQAESLLAELNAIEDKEERYARFCELKEENCEDTGTEAYQFAAGTMVEEFYNKSLELGEYEMDIVETAYGYHLMIGLPLDLDYPVVVQTQNPPLLREQMLNVLFEDQLKAWQDEAVIEKVGEFEDFDFTSVFGPSGFIYQSWADRAAAKKK